MLLLFVKQLVVSSRPGKSLLAIAAVALLSRPVLGQDKKLIEYGISVPDTFWIENNAALMQTAPLDGTVFDLTSTIAAPGVQGDFDWGVFGSTAWTLPELEPGIEAMQNAHLTNFTDNFLRVTTTGNVAHTAGEVDWFSSQFNTVINNFSLAGTVVKDTGSKGIFFDAEAYDAQLWNYADQINTGTESFTAYAAEVRLRGQEVMQALQTADPGITVMMSAAYTNPYRDGYPIPYTPGTNHFPTDSANPAKLQYIADGLEASFLDGMIDEANPTTKIIDGNEGTYQTETTQGFQSWKNIVQTGVLPLVGANPTKYASTMSTGFGVWLDVNASETGGWSNTNFTNNYWQPASFQTALTNALAVSDEYVWVYTQSVDFWPGETIPEPYYQAIVNAHNSEDASVPEPKSGLLICTTAIVFLGMRSSRRRNHLAV